jgi:hypothetical protein
MREPRRAVRQRRLGRKDGEAFGSTVYSAASRSASKDDEINVPVPFSRPDPSPNDRAQQRRPRQRMVQRDRYDQLLCSSTHRMDR